MESSNLILLIVAIMAIVVALASFVCLFLFKRSFSKREKKVVLNLESIERRFALKNENELKVSSSVGRNDYLKTDIEHLSKRLNDLEGMLSKISNELNLQKIEVSSDNNVSIDSPKKSENVKYAENKGNGYLRECSAEEAKYKLFLSTGQEAEVELCAKFELVKERPNDFLDDLAETKGRFEGATKYINACRGHAVKEDGKWKVTRKMNIEFK